MSAEDQLHHQNTIGLRYWSTQLMSAIQSDAATTFSSYLDKLKTKILQPEKQTKKRSKINDKDNLESLSKVFLIVQCKLQCFFTCFYTANNTVISPNFLVWKLCLSTEFPHQELR